MPFRYGRSYNSGTKKRENPGIEEKRKEKEPLTWGWIKKNALGKLRWFDFYRNDIEDILIAISGYYEEQRDNERIARRIGLMAVSPYMDKKFDIFKYWPIAGDEEINNQAKYYQRGKLLERLRQFKLNEQQKKHG